MKKTIVILALAAVSSAAFAQGKMAMINNSSTYVTMATAGGNNGLYPDAADASNAGLAVGGLNQLKNGQVLVAQLWVGSSAGSLQAVHPKSGSPSPAGGGVDTLGRGWLMTLASGQPAGFINTCQYILDTANSGITTPIAGGATAFYQIKVWNAAVTDYASINPLTDVHGQSGIFSMVTGSSVTYPTTAASITANGPIYVGVAVPEPTVAAIAGLGLASMMIFRRKK